MQKMIPKIYFRKKLVLKTLISQAVSNFLLPIVLAVFKIQPQNSTNSATGLSYFHRLKVTVLKSTFQKVKPKAVICRNVKHFD